jgi:hypothetical protein
MNDNIIMFLFLYEELNNTTNDILNFLENNSMNEVIKIHINKDDTDTKRWLTHNQKKVIINKFPVFIISQTGRNTEVRNASIPEAKNIYNIIKKITN